MTKKLFDILPDNIDYVLYGANDIFINEVNIDSRKVQSGDLYAAFVGTVSDGHNYIDSATEKGAVCIVCEHINVQKMGVTYIVTEHVREFLGQLLSKFYDNPTEQMTFVGITGTNGKTSVATLLFQLFGTLGYKCGLISTVQNRIGEVVLPSEYTTPDMVSLYQLIHQMQEAECTHVFMEVSSHALHQKRVAGIRYQCAVFTNITHDHLDYHGDMKHYISAKKLLFDHLDVDAVALVNADDRNGKVMLQNCSAKKKSFGLHSMCDFKAKIIESSLLGLHLKVNDREAFFRMVGEFNAYNLLAVIGVASILDIQMDVVIKELSALRGAEGRFEVVYEERSKKYGIIDYAHTPDALENVLKTIQKAKLNGGEIMTVVGCGGNRDKEKRPKMAQIACHYSDKVILTSDNPRNENPEEILDEMERGVSLEYKYKVLRIVDRYQAIKTAVMMAKNSDIILVAGKGHEKYQEIKGEKFPFDDKEILAELFK